MSTLQCDLVVVINMFCLILCMGNVIDSRSCGDLEKIASIVICMIPKGFP